MDRHIFKKAACLVTLVAFVLTSVMPSYAQNVSLPVPGTMVALSEAFAPPLIKGLKVDADDPFRLEFILDKGAATESNDQIKAHSNRLIKYFLASLTVPEKDLWVNLSPYEKDRIVPDAFGVTEMGRDLLAQDYLLKQVTASLLYPEGETGKKFWAAVYAKAQETLGTVDIPVDTFNKVWIVPEKAVIYEGKDSAYVVESRLKVMLESDYVARTRAESHERSSSLISDLSSQGSQDLAKEILREVVIPVLEKEVNEGRNFAQLRQVYHSLILAVWFKDKVKASILGAAYVNQNKTGGVDISDKDEKQKIWARYVEAFRRGAYNVIKEEVDPVTQEAAPRKYFSGGFGFERIRDAAQVTRDPSRLPQGAMDNSVVVTADMAMAGEVRAEKNMVLRHDRGVHVTPAQAINNFKRLVDDVLKGAGIGLAIKKVSTGAESSLDEVLDILLLEIKDGEALTISVTGKSCPQEVVDEVSLLFEKLLRDDEALKTADVSRYETELNRLVRVFDLSRDAAQVTRDPSRLPQVTLDNSLAVTSDLVGAGRGEGDAPAAERRETLAGRAVDMHGGYRDVYLSGDSVLKARRPGREWRGLLRHAIMDFNKYEYEIYQRFVSLIPAALRDSFAKVKGLYEYDGQWILESEVVKDFDGRISKTMRDSGQVRSVLFWKRLDEIVEFMDRSGIHFVNWGPDNVLVKRLNERDAIPVLIDLKKAGRRFFLSAPRLWFASWRMKQVHRRVERLKENFMPRDEEFLIDSQRVDQYRATARDGWAFPYDAVSLKKDTGRNILTEKSESMHSLIVVPPAGSTLRRSLEGLQERLRRTRAFQNGKVVFNGDQGPLGLHMTALNSRVLRELGAAAPEKITQALRRKPWGGSVRGAYISPYNGRVSVAVYDRENAVINFRAEIDGGPKGVPVVQMAIANVMAPLTQDEREEWVAAVREFEDFDFGDIPTGEIVLVEHTNDVMRNASLVQAFGFSDDAAQKIVFEDGLSQEAVPEAQDLVEEVVPLERVGLGQYKESFHRKIDDLTVFFRPVPDGPGPERLFDELIWNALGPSRAGQAYIQVNAFSHPDGFVRLNMSIHQPQVSDEQWERLSRNRSLPAEALGDLALREEAGVKEHGGRGLKILHEISASGIPVSLEYERDPQGGMRTTLWIKTDRQVSDQAQAFGRTQDGGLRLTQEMTLSDLKTHGVDYRRVEDFLDIAGLEELPIRGRVALPNGTALEYAHLAQLMGWIFHELGRNWIGRAVPLGARNFKFEFVKTGSRATMMVSEDGKGFDFGSLVYGRSDFKGLGAGLVMIREIFKQLPLGQMTVMSQGKKYTVGFGRVSPVEGAQEQGTVITAEFDLDLIAGRPGVESGPGQASPDKGGIDLTPGRLDVEARSAGSGLEFHFSPRQIDQLQNASGLTPVIIGIRTMTTTLPMFLGLTADAPAAGVPS